MFNQIMVPIDLQHLDQLEKSLKNYYSILKKTISGMAQNSQDTRNVLYEKARRMKISRYRKHPSAADRSSLLKWLHSTPWLSKSFYNINLTIYIFRIKISTSLIN